MLNHIKDLVYTLFFKRPIVIRREITLSGKVVLITGASKGIGEKTAVLLKERGANIIIFSRTIPDYFNSDDPHYLFIKGDVRNELDCENAVKKGYQHFGKIDVLINNVGLFLGNPIEKTTTEDWKVSFETNISSMYFMSKNVIPHMKKVGQGLIINLGSKISNNSHIDPKKVIYATTKYAVEGFTLALSRELQKFGIRVTCLMPATVSTFRSPHALKFLSPYEIAEIISIMIENEHIHFEKIIIKSPQQDI